MLSTNSIYSVEDGSGGSSLCLLTSTGPLGAIVMGELLDPIRQSDLDISIQGDHRQVLRGGGGNE